MKDAFEALGDAFIEAISDVVNWTLEAVKDLAHALYAVAASLTALVGEIAAAGYEVLKVVSVRGEVVPDAVGTPVRLQLTAAVLAVDDLTPTSPGFEGEALSSTAGDYRVTR